MAGTSLIHAAEPILARPNPAQYAWHEQERIMFVCIGVATWMGTEYDLHGDYDLAKLNPNGLDANEICQAAELWGAREILFVAAHVGGFCWWPTDTTPYNVTKILWKNGKGNLVKEMADACRSAVCLGVCNGRGVRVAGRPAGAAVDGRARLRPDPTDPPKEFPPSRACGPTRSGVRRTPFPNLS